MNRVGTSLALGFTLASLFLLQLTGPLVAPRHELVFHYPGSAAHLYLPAIADVLLLTVMLALTLALVRRRPKADTLVWSALLLLLPLSLVRTVYAFRGLPAPHRLQLGLIGCAVCLFVAANSFAKAREAIRRVRYGATQVLLFLLLPQLLLLGQMMLLGWQTRHLNDPPPTVPSPLHASGTAATAQPHVIWILLDELSFEQVYGHRFAGLSLPHFDQLQREATVFTQTTAAAQYTRIAVPAMLTGRALRRTQPSGNGRQLRLYPTVGKPAWLDPEATVFADARRLGLPASVAGWYEPYCRLLPGVLDRCFWTYSDALPMGYSRGNGFWRQTVAPFRRALGAWLAEIGLAAPPSTDEQMDVRGHQADYFALVTAGDALLTSGEPGLTLVHMPIPHPFGIFDRETASFPDHRTSYLDNLVLADAYLGHVRDEMMRRQLWDESTVVIMGDHSWRVDRVWRPSAHWTAEEQRASEQGGDDPRPLVMVKLPGQRSGAVIEAPFHAERTKAMLDRFLASTLTTPGELAAWVAAPVHVQ